MAQRASPSCYLRQPNPEISASKLISALLESGIEAVLGDSEATAPLYRTQSGRSDPACRLLRSASPCCGASHAPACLKAGSPFYVLSLLVSQTVTEFLQLKPSKIKQRMVRQVRISFTM